MAISLIEKPSCAQLLADLAFFRACDGLPVLVDWFPVLGQLPDLSLFSDLPRAVTL